MLNWQRVPAWVLATRVLPDFRLQYMSITCTPEDQITVLPDYKMYKCYPMCYPYMYCTVLCR